MVRAEMTYVPEEKRSYRPAEGAFGYTCNRCRRCCTGKRIRVNPYEVYRLARRLGISTTRFLDEYTVEGGTELAVRDDLSCVFLGDEGCGVHQDRPLVCRLYPLGRVVEKGAPDRYFPVTPHPRSEGVYSDDGTVAEYLEQQGAAPFLVAADAYFDLLARARATLSELGMRAPAPAAPGDVNSEEQAAEQLPLSTSSPWMDIDAVLAAESYGAGRADVRASLQSLSAEEALAQHLAILDRWNDALRGGLQVNGDAPQSGDDADHDGPNHSSGATP